MSVYPVTGFHNLNSLLLVNKVYHRALQIDDGRNLLMQVYLECILNI